MCGEAGGLLLGTWDMSLGTDFKAHYGLFSFFSMWLVFDFSMTDRHCFSKGNFADGSGGRLGSSAVMVARWPMATAVVARRPAIVYRARALDKVCWPRQCSSGAQAADRAAAGAAAQGDGGGIPAEQCTLRAPTSRATRTYYYYYLPSKVEIKGLRKCIVIFHGGVSMVTITISLELLWIKSDSLKSSPSYSTIEPEDMLTRRY